MLPEKIQLEKQHIYLIKCFIPVVSKNYNTYWEILNKEEQARAKRFYFAKDRVQSVCARGILRQILARCLALSPADICLHATPHGKLFLAKEDNIISLEFNLSHAHECIVYALTLIHPVGIDVEYPKDNIDYNGIAERFFSPHEQDQLTQLSPEQKSLGFYSAWTRKEAYIKAIGEGLSHPLTAFDVTLIPGEEARLLRLEKDPDELLQWTLHDFSPFMGYFAAFATKQKIEQICYWEVNGSG
jgi:4'-phosphopantetheinyl transferase